MKARKKIFSILLLFTICLFCIAVSGNAQTEPNLRKEKRKERVEFTGSLDGKAVEILNDIEGLLGSTATGKTEPSPAMVGPPLAQPIEGMDETARSGNGALGWFTGFALLFLVVIVIGLVWHIREVFLLQKKLEAVEQEELFSQRLVTHLYPNSPAAEAYRILRTNIQSFDPARPVKALLVTSALPGEGRTTALANLAITFAQMGSRVLLVDSALRRPLIHNLFELDRFPGLTEILTSGVIWTAAVNNTEIENLSVITSGKLPANPSEILGSTKMGQIIEEFKSRFDIVLFDSSDAIGVTDSAVLGSKLDGVFLAVRARKTQRETVLKAQSLLGQARVRILGYVLNHINTAIPQWVNRYLELLEPKL